MKEISKRNGIKWLNSDSILSLFKSESYPSDLKFITSVFCFAIVDDKVLFIKNKKPNRGIEIPGGHVDPGEAPELAVIREAAEEAMVLIKNPKLFALHKIENKVADGKYPKIGYQAFYYSNDIILYDFVESEEVEARLFYEIEEGADLDWSKYYPDLYNLFQQYHIKVKNSRA